MKRIALLLTVAMISTFALQAQTFKVGATLGLPAADAADISSFVLGVDAYYYFTDIDSFIEIGATAGFRNFFGKEEDILGQTVQFDDAQFIPVAAAARLKLFGIVSGGADLGYAFGVSDFLDGGFYFRPVVGVDIADTIELNASYENISDAATWGNINVGVLFEF
ncbi:hypothetical protein [Winogradskyella aurantia]|uniref:Outer membrane protein beta-barrel domain-containing protein n=1 Tax=Winogradskyella aurantia TaxID=1915063 RepID=A0A265UX74_9FLAO|nr:hypothetical protein [Winogradskyella aurantia]OZV69914.1 hypothetical protein CA834_04655 [Winogradskyella aurantia]